jgi:5-methylcytosine-specific restriction endonuclease McrA
MDIYLPPSWYKRPNCKKWFYSLSNQDQLDFLKFFIEKSKNSKNKSLCEWANNLPELVSAPVLQAIPEKAPVPQIILENIPEPQVILENDPKTILVSETFKRKTIPKSLRIKVWETYIGDKLKGNCYCCDRPCISCMDFEVGHVNAVANGGKNNIENLRPICGVCNKSMGTQNLEEFKKIFHHN